MSISVAQIGLWRLFKAKQEDFELEGVKDGPQELWEEWEWLWSKYVVCKYEILKELIETLYFKTKQGKLLLKVLKQNIRR